MQALLNFLEALGWFYVVSVCMIAMFAVPFTESFRKGIGLAVFWPLAFPLWAWRGFKEVFES